MIEERKKKPVLATAAVAAVALAGAAIGTAVARRGRRPNKNAEEIERKWVPAAPPSLEDKAYEEVRQGYILSGDIELRVRHAGQHYYLTVKREADRARDEWEVELEEWVFEALWPATKGHRLRKRRYTWKEKGHPLELDVYGGKLNGLIMLECEFVSSEAAARFTLPDWAAGAREVTDDRCFRNEALAREGLKKIRRRLQSG